jgi:hypothetical protein
MKYPFERTARYCECATAPSSVANRKARDVKAARIFPYEKRTEHSRGIQRCLEQYRKFEKCYKQYIRPVNCKNWTVFLFSQRYSVLPVAASECWQQSEGRSWLRNCIRRCVVVKRICEVLVRTTSPEYWMNEWEIICWGLFLIFWLSVLWSLLF